MKFFIFFLCAAVAVSGFPNLKSVVDEATRKSCESKSKVEPYMLEQNRVGNFETKCEELESYYRCIYTSKGLMTDCGHLNLPEIVKLLTEAKLTNMIGYAENCHKNDYHGDGAPYKFIKCFSKLWKQSKNKL